MINVPVGYSKLTILQARQSRTSLQARQVCLRSVHAEYRPKIASIRQRYRSLFPNDMIKGLERCLKNYFS